MSAIWPDPKDTDEVGMPISAAGRRIQLREAIERADALERAGRILDAAETRVFARLYADELETYEG